MHLANFMATSTTSTVQKEIKTPADFLMLFLAGRELGVGPMTAATQLFIVNGRIQMFSQLMLALAKRKDPTVEIRMVWAGDTVDDLACTATLWRKGAAVVEAKYSYADAVRSGQVGKQGSVWKPYPRDMLAWAVIKRALKLGAPDLINAVNVGGADLDYGTDAALADDPTAALIPAAPTLPDPAKGKAPNTTSGRGSMPAPIDQARDAARMTVERLKEALGADSEAWRGALAYLGETYGVNGALIFNRLTIKQADAIVENVDRLLAAQAPASDADDASDAQDVDEQAAT